MAMTDQDLIAIKDRLQTGYCNPHWRKHVVDLISEVERLQSLLDAITRLSAIDAGDFHHDPGSDTVIL